MKYTLLVLSLVFWGGQGFAQERVYRCGNEYTNAASAEKSKDCKLIEAGNVTIVPGARPSPSSGGQGNKVVTAPSGSPKVASGEQKARDAEARAILESELQRAQARQVQLLKEYNNGEPEKQGIEGRNHQRYLDRVASMKAEIDRNTADIEGINRELARFK